VLWVCVCGVERHGHPHQRKYDYCVLGALVGFCMIMFVCVPLRLTTIGLLLSKSDRSWVPLRLTTIGLLLSKSDRSYNYKIHVRMQTTLNLPTLHYWPLRGPT
jgi:hypothetical protein